MAFPGKQNKRDPSIPTRDHIIDELKKNKNKPKEQRATAIEAIMNANNTPREDQIKIMEDLISYPDYNA